LESMHAGDDMPSAAQVQAAAQGRATHAGEPQTGGTAGRLNWLRAGVLGANDGIVSVAGIVVGVSGAISARGPIFTAGLAGLVAAAVSMALGEYVSVSSQRDSERAEIAQEKGELAAARMPIASGLSIDPSLTLRARMTTRQGLYVRMPIASRAKAWWCEPYRGIGASMRGRRAWVSNR
jgi:hypothetical protein